MYKIEYGKAVEIQFRSQPLVSKSKSKSKPTSTSTAAFAQCAPLTAFWHNNNGSNCNKCSCNWKQMKLYQSKSPFIARAQGNRNNVKLFLSHYIILCMLILYKCFINVMICISLSLSLLFSNYHFHVSFTSSSRRSSRQAKTMQEEEEEEAERQQQQVSIASQARDQTLVVSS